MSIIIMIVLHHVWNERTESVNRCQPVNQSPHQAKETPRLVLNTALLRIAREYRSILYLLPPTSLTRAPSLLQTGIQPRCTLATQLWPFLMRFATSLCLPARHNQAFRESCVPQNPKPALSHHKAPHPH